MQWVGQVFPRRGHIPSPTVIRKSAAAGTFPALWNVSNKSDAAAKGLSSRFIVLLGALQ